MVPKFIKTLIKCYFGRQVVSWIRVLSSTLVYFQKLLVPKLVLSVCIYRYICWLSPIKGTHRGKTRRREELKSQLHKLALQPSPCLTKAISLLIIHHRLSNPAQGSNFIADGCGEVNGSVRVLFSSSRSTAGHCSHRAGAPCGRVGAALAGAAGSRAGMQTTTPSWHGYQSRDTR